MKQKLNTPNAHVAKLMYSSNASNKMFKAIDDLGQEAIEKIKMLLPYADKREDIYIDFPNNEAITLPHPLGKSGRVGLKRLYLDEKYELRFTWYGKDCTKGLAIADIYGAMDCIKLLDALLIHYGQ